MLDGEDAPIVDVGMLVGDVDSVMEGALVDVEVDEEVDVPDLVLTTFPFPSRTIP